MAIIHNSCKKAQYHQNMLIINLLLQVISKNVPILKRKELKSRIVLSEVLP